MPFPVVRVLGSPSSRSISPPSANRAFNDCDARSATPGRYATISALPVTSTPSPMRVAWLSSSPGLVAYRSTIADRQRVWSASVGSAGAVGAGNCPSVFVNTVLNCDTGSASDSSPVPTIDRPSSSPLPFRIGKLPYLVSEYSAGMARRSSCHTGSPEATTRRSLAVSVVVTSNNVEFVG